MEEEFYATIKLVSGEELVSKVCYLTDEDSLLLDKPLLVDKVTQKKSGKVVEGFSLKEWIASTYDEMFIIEMNKVMTISELDKKIEAYYVLSLNAIEDDDTDSKKTLSRQLGYIGSVEETKKKLEALFNKS
ncbi:methylamine utilization [Synechococcus phage S-CAM3]|uniref:Sm-like domain-containing protein n=1 Tax=Synechococcus phage S-CAM3 TaxID=1883366 RepID=A0A1D8KKE5_9CAUD|nr:methylamine utilization [Synechococcus phage S-CAM3]AOV59131.1 hypothetical protein C421010_148 [Synechococcus phage S-CAM3]